MHNFDNARQCTIGCCAARGIMESVESNNFYRLGTTLTTGLLAKLHLAVSQSLLAQELMGCAWYQTTATTGRQLSQLIGGFRWNHGISGIKQLFTTWDNLVISQSCTWRCRKACLRRGI